MKQVMGVVQQPQGHWVGDGFPVRSLFDYRGLGQMLNPFVMLDLAGPAEFEPTTRARGVGPHPHRGFETVTLVYEGEVAHRDSMGEGGVVGPGDVQWMTAGAGVLHQEFHSPRFTAQGGRLHMVQLWVNLPAKDKMVAPGYQALLDAAMARVPLPDGAGQARVVAGEFAGAVGPARIHSPMQVVDVTLHAGARTTLALHAGWPVALVVLRGQLQVTGAPQPSDADGVHTVDAGEMAVCSPDGSALDLHASADTHVLLLSGQPLGEPVVGHGPFVMNTMQEIHQAVADLQAGKFGHM